MKRELLIDSVCGRKRLAVLEDGKLYELRYEQSGHSGLTGNIYSGRVMNVLGGMNAAFVDIGLEKNAYLSASDIKLDLSGYSELSGKLGSLSIGKMVRPGQEILVQVIKEPGGTKGPRISGHVTLPGNLMVLLPTIRHIGVSRKIEDHSDRERLSSFAKKLTEDDGVGIIMRTASADADEASIVEEYVSLVNKWRDIQRRSRTTKAPALIYGGESLEKSALRDLCDNSTVVMTDDEGVYRNLISEPNPFGSEISFHKGDIPLFDLHSIDSQYEKALRHHVWLKSGGYLVIDHTEALTVIDVNTGKYTGTRSLEETIIRTNTEAAYEIARQLRIRDIGGIIIVDFIDMAEQQSRDGILDILRSEMSRDKVKSVVVGMTPLGLVEITRKKKHISADKHLMHTCSTCGGEGRIPSFEYIAWRIVYDLRRRGIVGSEQLFNVRLSGGVAGALIAIGAPRGMKVHVTPENIPDTEYIIEPMGPSTISDNLKLLRNS